MSADYLVEREQWVPRPIEEVFAFFSRAENLEKLTPSWLRFEVLTPSPIAIAPGAKIDYRLRWHGLPLRWTTRIEEWMPPYRFEDIQLKGPYRSWHHVHGFEKSGDGTRFSDVVQYSMPFGLVGRLAYRLNVRREVEQIFDYRSEKIRALFD